MKANLHLKSGQPVLRLKHPVPFSATQSLEKELSRLARIGAPHQLWLRKNRMSTFVCVLSFPTALNATPEDNHHLLPPVAKDIMAILNGSTCSSKLHLSEAYLQLEVQPECREYLTINTHRDLYQFDRSPFGLIGGRKGTGAYLDDIKAVGGREKEHKERIECLLERPTDYDFHLRSEKCEFFLKSTKYLAFTFDSESRRPDAEGIGTIVSMPSPTDGQTLRPIRRLITYHTVVLYLPCMNFVDH
ncbi:unnamed protein product [Hymenolepis diminuta]|uniref:Reverse transcriptase domain-containing protein n=1 Tax=Hymenolepis diminuta TaxID=6216 RepID=A0A0R3SGD9_HYMDI|nr:unnamed protein product [Hymenolepis diminuta]